ncbi:hypothetical protein JJB07_14085 [Tumebacillus sp. ITR2]|uniref:HTH cro/C1-type domain-containing protein n=1 Tax=Tumebacillus amylolyticus TaxID=2801339 RepID=A0ABS1JBW6_9BACL|nr:hypothetical protein [Tumebacillus amylolyticus]MBL0387766.1 hypothetical protein [Tumebacillus amylolyticus]
MSTLLAPSHTAVDKIPLGRRIEEIKREKGGYYSNVAMAGRLGIHVETLRFMLKGKREIYTFEFDKIAIDLKMSVERILQEDIKEEVAHLSGDLKECKNSAESIQRALRLMEAAQGISEIHYALTRLGIAFRNAYQFTDSNKVFKDSHQLALKMQEHYGETDALYSNVYHLIASFTAIQDYVTASKLLDEIMPFFEAIPSRLSAISYQKAKIEETNGNFFTAKEYAIKSYQYAEQSGNHVTVARTQLNLAHFHYVLSEYKEASELLVRAIEGLENDTRTQLIAHKELGKTLLKLELKEQALAQIQLSLVKAKDLDWKDMIGKLMILMSKACGDPSYAETILNDTTNSLRIRYLASKCLLEHFKTLNDGANFLHYSKITEGLCVDFADVLDEGEL